MNHLKKIFILLAVFIAQGCDKDVLDLKPKDQVTELSTYDNFKTYAWRFYRGTTFPGYERDAPNSEWNADLFLHSVNNGESDWLWERITVPSSSNNWDGPYNKIRNINFLLESLEGSEMSEEEKHHWRAVGYFFRAYNYADLVNKYGDVPLITKVLTESSEELYMPRTPRDEVAQQIMDDLLYAEENIKPNGEGEGSNTLNVHVIRAFISRFGLREGTWRKYQGIGGGKTYLRASVEAAEKLIADFPTLHPNFDELYNSASLAGIPGIILYKQYEAEQITHNQATGPGSSNGRWDLTKKAVDKYLMLDGETRWTSPLFDGDKNPYEEFRNRDRRLYYTVPPPYKIEAGTKSFTFEFTDDPADAEYFPVMEALSDDLHKTLPTTNWNGFVVRQEPHFKDNSNGQPFSVTYTGYRYYKPYNRLNLGISSQDISDFPIFRIGEVLVNYAEAKFELGEFDQSIADITIKRLRERGGVAPLILGSITNDPTRDPSVDPVLWEIRRERAIELMGDGFRFDDLRRWKKLVDYGSEKKLGRWIDRSRVENVPIENGASEGYVDYFGVPPGVPEYYYLYPIPSDQLVLNPELEQNPGW